MYEWLGEHHIIEWVARLMEWEPLEDIFREVVTPSKVARGSPRNGLRQCLTVYRGGCRRKFNLGHSDIG